MTPTIVIDVHHGPRWLRSQRIPLTGMVTMGSAPTCDVVLAGIGPHHAFLMPAEAGVRLIAGRGYEVHVAGIPVRETLPLEQGQIEVGPYRLGLCVEPASPAPVEAVGDRPLADVPLGWGDPTLGDATLGDATRGDATLGDATRGDATRGDATRGDATLGDATLGDATRGDATLGDATLGEPRWTGGPPLSSAMTVSDPTLGAAPLRGRSRVSETIEVSAGAPESAPPDGATIGDAPPGDATLGDASIGDVPLSDATIGQPAPDMIAVERALAASPALAPRRRHQAVPTPPGASRLGDERPISDHHPAPIDDEEGDTLTDIERCSVDAPAEARSPGIVALWLTDAPSGPMRAPSPMRSPATDSSARSSALRSTIRGEEPARLSVLSPRTPTGAWSAPAPLQAAPGVERDKTPWSLSSPGMAKPAPRPVSLDGLRRRLPGILLHLVIGDTIDGRPDRLPRALAFTATLAAALLAWQAVWPGEQAPAMEIPPRPAIVVEVWIPPPEPDEELPEEPTEEEIEIPITPEPKPVAPPEPATPTPVEEGPEETEPPPELPPAPRKQPTQKEKRIADAYQGRLPRPRRRVVFDSKAPPRLDAGSGGVEAPSAGAGSPRPAPLLDTKSGEKKPSLGPKVKVGKGPKAPERRVPIRKSRPRLVGASPEEKKRIERAMDWQWSEFTRCFRIARHTRRDLAGRLTMSFEISASGDTEHITGRLEPPAPGVDIVACFARHIEPIRIKRATPGTIGVNYSYILGD